MHEAVHEAVCAGSSCGVDCGASCLRDTRCLGAVARRILPGRERTLAWKHQGKYAPYLSSLTQPSLGHRRVGDVVDHGRTGLLFDPDVPGSLHEHVDALVGDATWRAALGAAAEEAVRGRSWEALTAQLVGHYDVARTARSSRVA